MTYSRTIPNVARTNAIQSHINFWDYREKGYISPIDVIFGLISLGYGTFSSVVLGFLLALVFSVSLQVSWVPDFFFRFSSSALVNSRQQLSGVFDGNGVFIPKKFEALYKKHAKSGDKITIVELLWLTKEQKKLGFDLKQWAIAVTELFVAYFFVGQKGIFLKEDLMALYNGALFYQIELKHISRSNQTNSTARCLTIKEQLTAVIHAAFKFETYTTSCTTFGRKCAQSCDSPCAKKPVTDSSNEAVLSKFLVISVPQLCNSELPKKKKTSDATLVETAVVLHSSNLQLPFTESFATDLKSIQSKRAPVVDVSSYAYDSADCCGNSDFYHASVDHDSSFYCDSSTSSDNLSSCGSYSCEESDTSGSFEECSFGLFTADFTKAHTTDQLTDSYSKLSTISSYCDASISSDIPLSQLASRALLLMAQSHKVASIPVSVDCSSKGPSTFKVDSLISGEEFTQISNHTYTPPKMDAQQLFCQFASKTARRTKKTKKSRK